MFKLEKKIYYEALKKSNKERLYQYEDDHDIMEEIILGHCIRRYFIKCDEVSLPAFLQNFKDKIVSIKEKYITFKGECRGQPTFDVKVFEVNIKKYWYRNNFKNFYKDINITPNWVKLQIKKEEEYTTDEDCENIENLPLIKIPQKRTNDNKSI